MGNEPISAIWGFKWGSEDVTKISDDSDKGYIIECDLQYPEYLHNLHSDLPLGAENRISDGPKQAKLLTTRNIEWCITGN
ncbi:uncharacterized protein TNCV_5013851 [Trichonephila clavipes]|nr:uncharacterized protein TNCV_5013851 [Trichonephila clavipes]